MSKRSAWAPGPPEPPVPDGVVHVWQARLDPSAADVERLAGLLTEDELARTWRFHFERDRRRFVVGRGVLRSILSRYVHREARQLKLGYGAHGKPYLEYNLPLGAKPPILRFNLAHSHELAVYAFTTKGEVGIDLEFPRTVPDIDQIARRFFSPGECAALHNLAAEDRATGFFNCWTRKEAYIKLLGSGLSHPLRDFQVTLAPGEPAHLVWVKNVPDPGSYWSLHALPCSDPYVGALAMAGAMPEGIYWQYIFS